MLRLKKAKPHLNVEEAEQILECVFQENQAAAHSVDLKKIVSYSNYRRERFLLQKAALIAMLFLFLLLPLLFLAPSFTVRSDAETYSAKSSYTMEVASLLPVKHITASIDGRHVPVLETDFHQYSIRPGANGRLSVTVTLVNGQYTTHYTEVSNVDTTAPVLISHQLKENSVHLHLSEDGSGVNYQGMKAVTANGEETDLNILSYNSQTGLVVLAWPEEPVTILIPDYAGNILQLSLAIK